MNNEITMSIPLFVLFTVLLMVVLFFAVFFSTQWLFEWMLRREERLAMERDERQKQLHHR